MFCIRKITKPNRSFIHQHWCFIIIQTIIPFSFALLLCFVGIAQCLLTREDGFEKLYFGSLALDVVHDFSHSCCVKLSGSWSAKNLSCLSRNDVLWCSFLAEILLHLGRPCLLAAARTDAEIGQVSN